MFAPEGDVSVPSPVLLAFQELRLPFAGAIRIFNSHSMHLNPIECACLLAGSARENDGAVRREVGAQDRCIVVDLRLGHRGNPLVTVAALEFPHPNLDVCAKKTGRDSCIR